MNIKKSVPNHVWLYCISDDWKLYSCTRTVKHPRWWPKLIQWKKIIPHVTKRWYMRAALSKDGKKRKFMIHRLVAAAFLGLDIEDKQTFVCHRDDNPLNNRLDNLFIWTAKDNIQDMFSKGRENKAKWERHWSSKLTEIQVIWIKYLLAEWYRQKALTLKFWVSRQTIWDIDTWRRWNHVKIK